MKQHWGNLIDKVNGMSLRERVLVFAAAAFMLVSLTKVVFLDPLLNDQKKLSEKVQQQGEKVKEIQAQIDASTLAKRNIENSPLRYRLDQAKQQLADGDAYLQSLRNNLVTPVKMAELLEQVLNKNGRLRLLSLQTLPVAPLTISTSSATAMQGKEIFKHSVEITVRGSYMDLLQYLTEIEHLPTQMFWGKAEMNVEQHPDVNLKVIVYTLSLDKTWLTI